MSAISARLRAGVLLTVLALLGAACSSTAQDGASGDAVDIEALAGGPGATLLPRSPEAAAADGDAAPTDSTVPGGAPAVAGAPGAAAGGGSATPGAAPAGRPGGAAGALAASGPGIDDTTVTIGIVTVDEAKANALYGSLGAGAIDAGPQQTAAKAMVKYFNEHGGIGGRTIEALYYVVDPANSAATTEQQICAQFTQDNKVFAVMTNVTWATENIPTCLKNAGTIFLVEDTTAMDEGQQRKFAPYYYAPAWYNQTANARVYVNGLVDSGFLTKESRIGLLYYDTPVTVRTKDVIAEALEARGLKLTEAYAGAGLSDPQWAGPAVVRFRSSQIDKVLIVDLRGQMLVTFTTAAESQGYRPTYGLNSFSIWTAALSLAPPEQLVGAVGIGHRPVDDVNSRDFNESIKRCLGIYTAAGVEFKSPNAVRYSVAYCDLLFFLQAAVAKAPEVSAAGIRQGVAGLGTSWESALTMSTSFGADGLGGASGFRHATFDPSCTCFHYTSDLVRT